jgi:2-C-methyl-D-erythritol 4-phosphate cytidylyltransferase
MLAWAVDALLADARVQDVVVGVQADDAYGARALADFERVRLLPSAGQTRAHTVLQTLVDSGFEEQDWVLVHDAARPGLPVANLSALIDACLQHQQGGLLAMPVADTVKLAQAQTPVVVQRTLARETIWLAQTPQMFRVGALKQALSQALAASAIVTDEASAMERAGWQPLLIAGSARNHKVTWDEDFEWIQRCL